MIGIFAPGRYEKSSTEPYLVSHHQILAHGSVASIYKEKYQLMKSKVCMVIDCEWAKPASESIEDKNATARRLDFQLGWFFFFYLVLLLVLEALGSVFYKIMDLHDLFVIMVLT